MRLLGLLTVSVLSVGSLLFAAQATAAPLSAGNLVVLHVGDSAAPGGAGNLLPVQLLEYSTLGSLQQSIAVPATDSGSNNALTINRLRNNGGLNRSADGQLLVFGGTDAEPRTTPADPVGRTIGVVDVLGNVDTSNRFSDAFGGVAEPGIRSVATIDGSGFWVSGDGTGDRGVRYLTDGSSTSTAITDPSAASRHLTIFGGQLITSNGSATNVGTGLPTTGLQTLTQFPGLPLGPANSPVLFNLNPAVPGADVLYTGNEDGPALSKYTFDGTTWTLANTFSTTAVPGLLFLTGQIEGGDVVIYGTTRSTGNPSFGNSIVRLVDVGAPSTFSVLATADATHGFRGISFAPVVPVPEPSSIVLALAGVGAVIAFQRRRHGAAK